VTITWRRKTREEFASESYTSCHVRPPDIFIIYIIFSAVICVIYIYILCICNTFPQSFVFCGPISTVIAILYSDFYPIYYSSSVLPSPHPATTTSTLIPQRFSKIPEGYVSDVFICRRGRAGRRNPLFRSFNYYILLRI